MLSTNEFKAGGFLISKNIILGFNKETKKEWAMANLTLQVEDTKRVELSIFSNKLNGSGNSSKIYENLMTIKDEYNSLGSYVTDKRKDDKAKPSKLEATTVSKLEECDFIFANKGIKLSMNRYPKDGKIMESFRMSTNFVNRAKETDNKEPYIEGNLVGVVERNSEKLIDEEGNESVKVTLIVPEYREAYNDRAEEVVVDKFELILKDQESEAIDYCMSIFEEGKVCCIGVEPLTEVVTEKPKEDENAPKRGFGKITKFEPTTKINKELRIVGAYDLEEAEYMEDGAFKSELYQKALESFEDNLKKMESEKGKETNATRTFGKKDNNVPF